MTKVIWHRWRIQGQSSPLYETPNSHLRTDVFTSKNEWSILNWLQTVLLCVFCLWAQAWEGGVDHQHHRSYSPAVEGFSIHSREHISADQSLTWAYPPVGGCWVDFNLFSNSTGALPINWSSRDRSNALAAMPTKISYFPICSGKSAYICLQLWNAQQLGDSCSALGIMEFVALWQLLILIWTSDGCSSR